MATPAVLNPQDLWQARQVFGVIKSLALSAGPLPILTAFKAQPRSVILTHVTFDNFSAFAYGAALPAAIGVSWGTDALAQNMFNGTFGASALVPFCLAQRTDLAANTPYINTGQSLLFQLAVGVAASGTCDVTFVGAFL